MTTSMDPNAFSSHRETILYKHVELFPMSDLIPQFDRLPAGDGTLLKPILFPLADTPPSKIHFATLSPGR